MAKTTEELAAEAKEAETKKIADVAEAIKKQITEGMGKAGKRKTELETELIPAAKAALAKLERELAGIISTEKQALKLVMAELCPPELTLQPTAHKGKAGTRTRLTDEQKTALAATVLNCIKHSKLTGMAPKDIKKAVPEIKQAQLNKILSDALDAKTIKHEGKGKRDSRYFPI